jgi:hypothetical protein
MASSSKRTETMTSPLTTGTSPKTVTTFGPAGTTLDVRESGANILVTFCHGFPETDKHSILPEYFGDNITELLEPLDNLSNKEKEQLRGRNINQTGEGHELVVFNLFVRLVRQINIPSTMLIMRTFEMDNKNPAKLKRRALLSLLPNIKFKKFDTNAENDYVVLLKTLGIVFVEVKGSTRDNNIRSAEKQLTNVNGIVQRIMKAMTKDEKRTIPSVKLIIVPDITDETPTEPTSNGSYFIFKDKCDTFNDTWMDIINKLQHLKTEQPFTLEEFKELSEILVGVWSATAVRTMQQGVSTYNLTQNEVDISRTKQLEQIDETVDTSNIRNERQFKSPEEKVKKPLTKIVRTGESDIFRSCDNLKLCYLTPPQNELFTSCKRAIVRGGAGCGKSILMLFKILELVHSTESTHRVLPIAPFPHNLRILNALRSNNVSVEVIEEFPPPPSSTSKVFVMELKKFLKVKRSTLMGYDMSNFHVFVDDAQSLNYERDVNGTTFFDVGDFIEQTFDTCVRSASYFWFMLDMAQGYMLSSNVNGSYSHDLFFTRYNQPRSYNIPIVHLQHVMRNTYQVMLLNNEAREEYVRTQRASSQVLPSPQVGHKVTSRVPVCHILQKGTNETHVVPFIISQLRELLDTFMRPPFSLPLSKVAIIYDYEHMFELYKNDVASFLTTEFGTTPHTIAEQLTTDNRTDIVMDQMEHIMSYEVPVVVFIRTGGVNRTYYCIGTRARVSLTILDVTSCPPRTYNNMDTVLWKPLWKPNNSGDGTFIKYTCTCGGGGYCIC